jgi:hypothetical protein
MVKISKVVIKKAGIVEMSIISTNPAFFIGVRR